MRNVYSVVRLYHAFKYLGKLKYDLQCGDYLAGALKLSNDNFNELLDFYINSEEYETCQKLVDKRKNDI